jgi:hypothetical protein
VVELGGVTTATGWVAGDAAELEVDDPLEPV